MGASGTFIRLDRTLPAGDGTRLRPRRYTINRLVAAGDWIALRSIQATTAIATGARLHSQGDLQSGSRAPRGNPARARRAPPRHRGAVRLHSHAARGNEKTGRIRNQKFRIQNPPGTTPTGNRQPNRRSRGRAGCGTPSARPSIHRARTRRAPRGGQGQSGTPDRHPGHNDNGNRAARCRRPNASASTPRHCRSGRLDCRQVRVDTLTPRPPIGRPPAFLIVAAGLDEGPKLVVSDRIAGDLEGG